jgi:beta-galactosidase GanA
LDTEGIPGHSDRFRGHVGIGFSCAIIWFSSFSRAQTTQSSLPRIVHQDGRYALFVDDSPFLVLGAQINNSSAWPAMLPKVWPAMEYLHANTVEMPVYWEQLEPQKGRFDYSVVDTLLSQARDHKMRLILLWFGTWKNGSAHYMPLWMKRDPQLYPNLIGHDGRPVDSPSPHAQASLEADIQAFTAFMQHLKDADPQRTVLMVQVENEPGTWGSVRDYSPQAHNLFAGPVPIELLTALKKPITVPIPNWTEAFGNDADEYFHAWSIARYIGQVAAAGKAVYPLPMYVNVSVRDPIESKHPSEYEHGAANAYVLPIWKTAAPAIDLIAPDIYRPDSDRYLKILDLYARPDNPLLVPETGRSEQYSRYFFAALGHQAIGFAPFGVDYTAYADDPPGSSRITEASLAPFAMNYRAIAPMDREVALLNFQGKVQAVAEEDAQFLQTLAFDHWKAEVAYGLQVRRNVKQPTGNPTPVGRALVAQLGDDEFLVTGFFCRVRFHPVDGKQTIQYLRVEEGQYQDGQFQPIRIWNGDQTDWGLNFSSAPQVLRVMLSTR